MTLNTLTPEQRDALARLIRAQADDTDAMVADPETWTWTATLRALADRAATIRIVSVKTVVEVHLSSYVELADESGAPLGGISVEDDAPQDWGARLAAQHGYDPLALLCPELGDDGTVRVFPANAATPERYGRP